MVSGRSDPRFQSIEVLFIPLNAELSEPLRLRIRLKLRFHKGIVSSSIVIINTWTFDAGLGLNSRWTGEAVSWVKDAVSLAEGASSGIVLGALASSSDSRSRFMVSCLCSLSGWECVGLDGKQRGSAASGYEASREIEVVGSVKNVVPPLIMKYLEALCLRRKKKRVFVFGKTWCMYGRCRYAPR